MTFRYGLTFFLPAAIFGFFLPRRWYLVGPLALVAVTVERVRGGVINDTMTDWIVLTMAPIALAYMGAWIGATMRRGVARRRRGSISRG